MCKARSTISAGSLRVALGRTLTSIGDALVKRRRGSKGDGTAGVGAYL